MTSWRYSVPGVPPLNAGQASSAFTPFLSWAAASSAVSYKYAVTGTMGRGAVPAPTTATQMDSGPATLATTGRGRSSDAPAAWWPQEWYQGVATERPGAGMPVRVYSPTMAGPTTVLPVPATDYRAGYVRDSATLARRTILQRARALPWFPRILPDRTGTFNG